MNEDDKTSEGMLRVETEKHGFVGYVNKTSDHKANIKAAGQLLRSKGLKESPTEEELIFRQAIYFIKLALDIRNKDLSSFPGNSQGFVPFVVNATFGAELLIKCLLRIHGQSKNTHTLTALFKQLPNKIKDKINKCKKHIEPQFEVDSTLLFKDHLKVINNEFEEWRYIYEKDFAHFDIPTVLLVLNVLHDVASSELEIREARDV